MHLGNLRKMAVELADPVRYSMVLNDSKISMNEHIGSVVSIRYTGTINCVACGRKTKKSFQQGYCFPCTQKLAECDICIVRPEKCHFDQGTCRDPEWAQSHCFQDHIVYLANSSGLKVGITRMTQIPTRWIDQGATQAIPLIKAVNRQQVGIIEDAMKDFIADKTDWRKMLKGSNEQKDMIQEKTTLLDATAAIISEAQQRFGEENIQLLDDAESMTINYPVAQYPEKIKSLNLDKTPELQATLVGIKGQYLIFDTGVINMRKYGGYEIELAFT